jgi:hypothetical protein
MLKILVLIVFSLILNAKDYPLERKLNLVISNHTTTVLEFPFKIIEKRFDPFKRTTYITKNSSVVKEDSDLNVEVPKVKQKVIKIIDGKKVEVIKNVSPEKERKNETGRTSTNKTPIKITVSKDGNIMELRPNMTGTIKMIIWGHKKFPIMISVNIVNDDNKLSDYYKFIDFETPKKDLINFESGRHEEVVLELLKNGYLEKSPSGYRKEIINEILEDKKGKNKITLTSILSGQKYSLKTYEFENLSDKNVRLENRMFYQEGKVYGVSIEKNNKTLIPHEITRVFVVGKKD